MTSAARSRISARRCHSWIPRSPHAGSRHPEPARRPRWSAGCGPHAGLCAHGPERSVSARGGRCGLARRRAEVLKRLAVVARRLEETVSMSLEAAYARLRAVLGVGPWTAARTAMLALGDCDAVFIGDLHLPHLVSSALAGERRGSDERMLELLEPYRGHRARGGRLLMAGGS